MGALLATITTLLITVLTAALAAPYLIDWNDYKQVFEAQAAKIIGRPVKVGGKVSLTILPAPQVSFAKVRIADVSGKFERPFAEAQSFKLVLSLAPLLSGAIEARRIELEKPVFRLAIGADGKGNWRDLGPSVTAFPLMPREVTVKAVEISGGTIELHTGGTRSPYRIEALSGAVTSEALEGPYKFTGEAVVQGEKRELRFSAKQGQGGVLHLKGAMRDLASANLYQLDGQLDGFDGPLRYEGPLSARLMLGAPRPAADPRAEAPAVELKASAALGLYQASLTDLSITVEHQTRPQTLSGKAYAAWRDTPRLDLELQSGWTDLDHWLGTGLGQGEERVTPIAVLQALPRLWERLPFRAEAGGIKAAIGQIALGGDTAQNVSFKLTRAGGRWLIEDFAAQVPGDSELRLTGSLQESGGGLDFSGQGEAKGRHLSRFIRWLAPRLSQPEGGEAQDFALRGRLRLNDRQAAVEEARGEIAGAVFSGGLRYEFGPSPKLAVTLEGGRLDLNPVFGKSFSLAALLALAGDNQHGKDRQAGGSHSNILKTLLAAGETRLDLRAAQLGLSDFEARDVEARLRLHGGRLDIEKLSLSTAEGLTIRGAGRLDHPFEAPSGPVKFTLQAPTAAALKTLLKSAAFPDAFRGREKWLEALAPLNLTVSFAGRRERGQAEFKLSGSAAESQISLTGRLEGNLNSIWDGRLDVAGGVTNASGGKLIGQIAPGMPNGGGGTSLGRGALTLKADGPLKAALNTVIELKTEAAEGKFEGKLAVSEAPWSLDGQVFLKAKDAGVALALLQWPSGGEPVTGAFELRAAALKSGASYHLKNIAVRLGETLTQGSADIHTGGAIPAVTARFTTAEASLPRLLGYLVDFDWKSTDAAGAPPGSQASTAGVWPDRPFAVKAFESISGALSLKAQKLKLDDAVALEEAALDASLDKGALTVSTLQGKLYGGDFSAQGALSSHQGRISLDARITLNRADLEKLSAHHGQALAAGAGSLDLRVSGQGISPRGLVSILSGKGEISLSEGIIYSFSPGNLWKTAEAYLESPRPQHGSPGARLAEALQEGDFFHPPVRIPVTIKDGVLQMQNASVQARDAVVKPAFSLDLSTLKFDSEWELMESKGTRRAKFPPVRLVFAGPLSGLHTVKPALQIDALEQHLTVRRMEGEVERLEKQQRRRGRVSAREPEPADDGETQPSPAPVGASITGAPRVKPAGETAQHGRQPPPDASDAANPPVIPPSRNPWRTETEIWRTAPAARDGKPLFRE